MKPFANSEDPDEMQHFIYGKCSKISNTLKLRTPKIITENNF